MSIQLKEIIRKYPRAFINGFSLYYPINEYLLSEYPDIWDWKLLSRNTSIKWSEGLIKEFEDRWYWGYQGLSNNESLPWSVTLLSAFANRWSWYHLGWQSKVVNDRSMFELCLYHWNEWHQKNLFSEYAFMPALTGKSIEWAENVFEDWKNLNWSLFSRYEGFPWSEAFIRKHEERFNWEALSDNKALPWSERFINTYLGRWDWRNLSYNKSIPWTINMLEKFRDNVHWGLLSANSYRHWDIEMLIHFREQLCWIHPQHNEAGDLMDVDGLIINPSILWTPELFQACCGTIHIQFQKLIEEERGVSHDYVVLQEYEYWTIYLDSARFSLGFIELLINMEANTSKHYIDWHQFALEFNQWNTLDTVIFNHCLSKVDLNLLASNEFFPWHNHDHLLAEITDETDHTGYSGWDRLSYNKGLMITSEILERYSAHWNWKLLSYNPNLTTALLKQFEQHWDLEAIMKNSTVAVNLLKDSPERWNLWWRENRNPPFGSLANFQSLLYLDEQSPMLTEPLFHELDNILYRLTNKPDEDYREDFISAMRRGDWSLLVPAITHDRYLPLLEEFSEELLLRKWTTSFLEQLASKAYFLLKAKNYESSIMLFKLVLQMELESRQKINDLSPYCNALYVLQKDNSGLPVNYELNHLFLEKCLPFGPKNPAIYFNAACLYAEMNNIDAVFECINLARKYNYDGYTAMIEEMKNASMFINAVTDPRFQTV